MTQLMQYGKLFVVALVVAVVAASGLLSFTARYDRATVSVVADGACASCWNADLLSGDGD